MRVTNGIPLGSTPLTGWHCKLCPNTEGTTECSCWAAIHRLNRSDLTAHPHKGRIGFTTRQDDEGARSTTAVEKSGIIASGIVLSTESAADTVPLGVALDGTKIVVIPYPHPSDGGRGGSTNADAAGCGAISNRVVVGEVYILYGARFPAESYTRGCHWIPRMFA
jgi:hypothetical protein